MNNKKMNVYGPSESRFLQLIESLPKVAVQGYDKHRNVIYWNNASTSIYGYSKNEALGKKLEDLIIPDQMKEVVVQAHKNWIEKDIPIPAGELTLRNHLNQPVYVYSTHVMLKQGTDNPEMFCVDVDLTTQHETALELQRIATTDSLTGLPNRHFFEEELSRRISEAKRFDQQIAVLFIDIDLFKEINDTLGHSAGDLLLQKVAQRLKPKLRRYDTLSRFGGDEFLVILPNIKDNSDVECVIHKIMAEFEETYSLLDQNIYITSTIGISLFPKDGDNTHTLLKHADTAMYQAKDDGRNRFRFFDQSLNDHLLYQRNIASNLRHSLDLDQFHLVFQPQIDLREKRITSCEALLRWTPEPPVVGVTPDIFIPIAERSDLIIHIGNWVLKNACIQLAQWRENGIEDIRIDINVSARQLDHSRFIPTFEQTLHTYNLRPKDIGIELTEHALIKANKDLLEKLDRLRSSGVNVSIDDFGTGYSSLNYLRQFPVNYLKIDRDFVTEAPNSKKDEAILRAIIEVGHALDLLIVVEGVETQCQAQFCQDMGSDLAQGYWYFKPMAADKILPILLNDKS